MATENGGTPEQQEEQDRRPTERVIVEKIRALAIPDDATDDQIRQAVEVLRGGKRARAGFVQAEAWVEVSRQTAPSKKAAIELYAGKAGTATAKVGEWRAPSLTAWKGGLKHSAPPKPLIEAEAFE